jgi:predicted aspartyl protease
VKPDRKPIKVRLADGRSVSRRIGSAVIHIDGQSIPTRVLFGGPSDPALLGAIVLEAAGLLVDPVERKLVKKGFVAMY